MKLIRGRKTSLKNAIIISDDWRKGRRTAEICGDNRFEIIAKARKDIIEATNIESSEDEMKVLDNFLFRCWQMGWLDKYDDTKVDRLKLVQETVGTVMSISNGNSTEDKMARNIARLFQNALDGSFPDFESIEGPKTGHWIIYIDDLFPGDSAQECSVCHEWQFINGNDDNYCPNCGAKMKEEDNEYTNKRKF